MKTSEKSLLDPLVKKGKITSENVDQLINTYPHFYSKRPPNAQEMIDYRRAKAEANGGQQQSLELPTYQPRSKLSKNLAWFTANKLANYEPLERIDVKPNLTFGDASSRGYVGNTASDPYKPILSLDATSQYKYDVPSTLSHEGDHVFQYDPEYKPSMEDIAAPFFNNKNDKQKEDLYRDTQKLINIAPNEFLDPYKAKWINNDEFTLGGQMSAKTMLREVPAFALEAMTRDNHKWALDNNTNPEARKFLRGTFKGIHQNAIDHGLQSTNNKGERRFADYEHGLYQTIEALRKQGQPRKEESARQKSLYSHWKEKDTEPNNVNPTRELNPIKKFHPASQSGTSFSSQFSGMSGMSTAPKLNQQQNQNTGYGQQFTQPGQFLNSPQDKSTQDKSTQANGNRIAYYDTTETYNNPAEFLIKRSRFDPITKKISWPIDIETDTQIHFPNLTPTNILQPKKQYNSQNQSTKTSPQHYQQNQNFYHDNQQLQTQQQNQGIRHGQQPDLVPSSGPMLTPLPKNNNEYNPLSTGPQPQQPPQNKAKGGSVHSESTASLLARFAAFEQMIQDQEARNKPRSIPKLDQADLDNYLRIQRYLNGIY